MTDSIHFLVIFRPLLSNFMQNVGNSQDNYLAKSGRTQKKNGRKRPIFLRLIEIFFSTIGIYNQRCGGRHEWLSPNVGFTGSRWQQINNPGRKKNSISTWMAQHAMRNPREFFFLKEIRAFQYCHQLRYLKRFHFNENFDINFVFKIVNFLWKKWKGKCFLFFWG